MAPLKQVCKEELDQVPPQGYEGIADGYHKHLIAAAAARLVWVDFPPLVNKVISTPFFLLFT